MSDAFVPIRGLHHFAWRCRDCEETRHFYEDLLGLPLVHVIRADIVPSTGEYCPYVHIFFRMADGSYIAFFDLGDDVAAAAVAEHARRGSTTSRCASIRSRRCARRRRASRRPASRCSASPTTTSSSRSTSSTRTASASS